MPSIVTTIDIAAPPADVWRTITDFSKFEQWNPMIVSASGVAERGTTLRIRVPLREGRPPRPISAKVLVCDAEREIRWGGGLRPLLWVEHWVRLAPEGAGTRVEHGEQFDGWVARPGLWLLGLNAVPYERMNAALKLRVETPVDHPSELPPE